MFQNLLWFSGKIVNEIWEAGRIAGCALCKSMSSRNPHITFLLKNLTFDTLFRALENITFEEGPLKREYMFNGLNKG